MAFSTQKEFGSIPFLNVIPKLVCAQRPEVRLKDFSSKVDVRTWSQDKSLLSLYLYNLVTCKLQEDGLQNVEQLINTTDLHIEGGMPIGKSLASVVGKKESKKSMHNESSKSTLGATSTQPTGPVQQFDTRMTNCLCEKIKSLSRHGEISKQHANEIVQMCNRLEELCKIYGGNVSEKAALKSNVSEKAALKSNVSEKAALKSASRSGTKPDAYPDANPDGNTDAKSFANPNSKYDSQSETKSEQRSAHNKEQNQRCQPEAVENCEDSTDWKKSYECAYRLFMKCRKEKHDQCNLIKDLEGKIDKMQQCYENKRKEFKITKGLLEGQMTQMQNQLCRLKCQLKKMDCIQMENDTLLDIIYELDTRIIHYEIQFKQLMHKTRNFKENGYRLPTCAF